MITKEVAAINAESPKKERFEFVFSVNGNIICQRYFKIYNFNRKAYASLDLVYGIDKCVDIINNSLKTKMMIYYQNTAPQVFENKEEMTAWLENHPNELDVPSYVILRDTAKAYVWNGEALEDYDGSFKVSEYLRDQEKEETPVVFKFAFLDNGREVCTKIWDGNIYPMFVRSNIDLSSTKNRYKNNETFDAFYGAIIDLCNESIPDCISSIMKELSNVCSMKDNTDYTSSLKFGNKTYSLDVNKINNRNYETMVRGYEKACRKKTAEYFKYLV